MFKLGAIFEKNLGPKLRVTVIAAGFDTNGDLKDYSPPPVPVAEPEPTPEPVVDIVKEADELTEKEAEVVVLETLRTPESNGHAVTAQPEHQPQQTSSGPSVFIPQTQTRINGSKQSEPILHDVLVAEEKSDISEQIQRLLGDFLQVKGRYHELELDSPAYMRHKVVLNDMMLVPDHELIRVRLND
jgi:cell division protein FtsZ